MKDDQYKFYTIYNNILKEIEIIDNNKVINEKSIYFNYYGANNFSSLFRQRQSNPNPTQQRTNTQVQGRAYDVNRMWSPESFAGQIYEWNRGVIGISQDGMTIKEKLDGTANHHAGATVRVASSLGTPINDTGAPFEAAVNAASQGTLIFQSEGDNAFVYFPELVSEEQIQSLNDILVPRSNFNFSFTHNEELFEDVDFQAVLDYATQIKSLKASIQI